MGVAVIPLIFSATPPCEYTRATPFGLVVCLCKLCTIFLAWCSRGAEGFFSHFLLRDKQGEGWVYYDACLDPGRAPGRCFEHSESLSWLFL